MNSLFSTRLLFVFLVAVLPRGAQPSGEANQLLSRAIAASGGENALSAATVLKWSAKATVFTPRGPLNLEGRWIVEPPDRAVVITWETDRGNVSERRMLLDGASGFMERGGERTAMPAAILANERDQFYLYSVMRLLPLRDRDLELSVPAPSRLLIRHPRRPDVEATFGDDGRLVRLQTTVSHPSNNSDIVQEMTFDGTIEAGGVRWPRNIRIAQDGQPFFEMRLSEFSLGTADEITKLIAR